MTKRSEPPFRADQVGSLLRPPELMAMRGSAEKGEVSAAELRAFEDDCIRDAVAMQEEIGFQSVTDGEFRRGGFHIDFIKKINNVSFQQAQDRADVGQDRGRKRTLPPWMAVVTGPMSLPTGGIEVDNFKFLKSVAKAMPKICIPSPTMTHFRGGREAIDKNAYPEMSGFFADLARVYRDELAALADAGCRYVQIDDTNLAYLCDEQMREGVRAIGEDPEELPRTYAALINDSIKDRPADMNVCIHLCRGNSSSSWYAEGGYEPVADALFNLTDVDGFFLEYDDERSGDFAPLRFVPKGKTVVLGLISSKNAAMEDPDALKRRIEDAAKYVPLDQLCLSPQCGFQSSTRGANDVTFDQEKAKLRLVIDVAEQVWN
jgi:5-methyltetrahydropteroyltriglutamate--homocysteine methyltransferase